VSPQAALAWLLAGVLVASVAAKLAGPARSAAAMATFGVRPPRLQAAVLALLVAGELGLAAAVAGGSGFAAYVAAATMAGFALALAAIIRRGGTGAPCACFGARARVSRRAVARDLGLAAAFAGLPSVPTAPVSATGWLAAGLLVALAGVLGLSVATLALAREIGELRLRLGPQLALELADEGPPVGRPVPLIGRFALDGDVKLALAVFSSEGCPLCRALEPSLEWLAGDPFVAMMVFDEHAEAGVWRSLGVPGSPYALVLDRAGTVLAKGAFNTGGQLEGMLATAERRAAPSHAEG
jgi:thiol-disulfide isomerase/thioredoxin